MSRMDVKVFVFHHRVGRRHRNGPPTRHEVRGGDVFVAPSAPVSWTARSLAASSYACRLRESSTRSCIRVVAMDDTVSHALPLKHEPLAATPPDIERRAARTAPVLELASVVRPR
jgi:hypothetical protein